MRRKPSTGRGQRQVPQGDPRGWKNKKKRTTSFFDWKHGTKIYIVLNLHRFNAMFPAMAKSGLVMKLYLLNYFSGLTMRD